MAGDWRLYLQVLTGKGVRVGYCSEPLNKHRRHAASVTHALDPDLHVAEIVACHVFANAAFELDPEITQLQGNYLVEVKGQLGATPDSASTLTMGVELDSEHSRTPLKRAM
jgi:hypothetical protein